MSSLSGADDTHTLRPVDGARKVDGGEYIDVAGHPVWHFVDGEGTPVVLMHGAFAGASSFGAQIPEILKAGWKVYAPERCGHAHSPDTDAAFGYSTMADETIAYLETAIGRSAHLVGWSDGAVVALLVAQRRPDLVDRMVLVGQYFNSSGRVADGITDGLLADSSAMTFLRAEYDAVSPDGPEHFETVYRKTIDMIAAEPEIDLASLASVTTPTLVAQGDRDEVTVAHSVDVVAALPAGRLAVLPGTHLLPLESPDVFNPLMLSFLAGDPPAQWDL
ncbi:alpha/beta fold hydrolase [Williamsia herbipolensis]|uniref:alpha/beta fold hydrolase n=1 Tax=Williamsia herbipolensis TaxID=1603258 RepID=UPI0009E61D46|nr:alpha/beta hydrolase [Williamsia herbipolensis]